MEVTHVKTLVQQQHVRLFPNTIHCQGNQNLELGLSPKKCQDPPCKIGGKEGVSLGHHSTRAKTSNPC